MPHEITIGVGAVILGEGEIDGQRAVILRPVEPGSAPGSTLPIFDSEKIYRPQADDTVLWIKGHPDILIRALVSAGVHLLP